MLKTEELKALLLDPRNALVICLLLFLLIALRTFTDSPYPGGVDSATHLFQIGLMSSEGQAPWDHWWYGGIPLLEQYPPLSHWLPGLAANALGVENSYKLFFTLAFLAIPLSFFLLVREFGFDGRQKAFALYVLSLSPVFSYDLQGGVYSSIFALPFAFLFFKFAIRTLAAGKDYGEWLKPAILASVFLAFAALSHLFMPIAAAAFAVVYMLSFKPSIESIARFAGVCLFAAALVSFFWVPLVLNHHVANVAMELGSVSNIVTNALAPFGRAFAVYINLVSIMTVAGLCALVLISAWQQYESKDFRMLLFFAASIILIMAWVTFLPYGDSGRSKLPMFIPMLFAVFLAASFGRAAHTEWLPPAIFLLMLASVLLVQPSYVPPKVYDMAKWAANETLNRALMVPQGLALTNGPGEDSANPPAFLYDTYLLPYYFHKEVYDGWFPEAQPRTDTADSSFTCTSKRSPSELKEGFGLFSRMILGKQTNCTAAATPDEFCKVVKTGGVDTVVASEAFPEVVSYADSAPCLSRVGSGEGLVAYRVDNSTPYVTPASFAFTKKSGTVKVAFDGPFEGEIKILENYYPGWSADVDGSEDVLVLEGSDGFLRIPIQAGAGRHELAVTYTPETYSGIFLALSAISWLAALLLAWRLPDGIVAPRG